jgi:flagellar assembly factor FliW
MDQEGAIINFPAGLVGYPALTAYRLFEPKDSYPLKFLQAVGQEDISFTCIDVQAIKPDYVVPLGPEDPRRMTANLAGPVVVNVKTLQARQIVLNIDQFSLAYPVFPGK